MQKRKANRSRPYQMMVAATVAIAAMPLLGSSAIAQGTTPVLSGNQQPVLAYLFNGDSGATLTNSGTAGADGDLALDVGGGSGYTAGITNPGPSGAASDLNLSETIPSGGSSSNGLATGGGYLQSSTQSAINLGTTTDLDGISSFTVTGWLNEANLPIQAGGGTERIFDHTGTNSGYGVLFGKNTGSPQLTMNLNGGGTNLVGTPGTVLGQLNKWVFFAITYSGAGAGTVNIYSGDATTPVVGSGANFVTNTAAGILVAKSATNQYIALGNYDQNGASGGPFNRQFHGQLDDIRLYTATDTSSAALSVADLNTIRTADLAAPEPSSVVGFALGALCLGGLLLRKRSRATA